MNTTQIRNSIDSYNLKASTYQTLFREFDFQGFFKTASQLTSLTAYAAQSKEAPLAAQDVKALSSYKTIQTYIGNQITAFFSDKFNIQKLDEFIQAFDAIPEKYHSLIFGWTPSKEQYALCKKVLEDAEYFSVYGKQNFLQIMTTYLEAVLCNSLPNLSVDDVQGLVGQGYLTEEKFRELSIKGWIPAPDKIPFVYDALGLTLPVLIEKNDVKSAGTTFNTKNNIPRQELLQQLQSSLEKEDLSFVPYVFKKEGKPDTQAVAIYWNGEDIANLPQKVVDELYDKIEHPRFILKSYEVIGGYSATSSYGLKLSFEATGMAKVEETVDENQSIAYNPMNI